MQLGFYGIQLVERITRFLEDHKLFSFSFFSIFYFLGVCGRATSKPFWFDEIISWYVVRLPSFSAIWNALNENMDSNPPLFYFLVHSSQWAFGQGELATRLPSIICFWLALLFLFVFISRRCGSLMGYIGILFLCLSVSYQYAFEARPYALVLACCSASLLCWQSAVEGRFRRLALVGLTLSLSAALLSHFYAVLIFLPIMIGEAYRSLRSRNIDWPIWISMAIGTLALVPLISMMLGLRVYSEFFWSQPTKRRLVETLSWFYQDPLWVCFLALGCFVGLLRPVSSKVLNHKNKPLSWDIPFHEWIAAIILILLPIIGFALAKAVTNAFVFRYFLPATIGVALGLVFLYQHLLKERLWIATIILVVLLSAFIAKQTGDAGDLVSKKPTIFRQQAAELLSVANDDPLVMSNPLIFLTCLQYASPDFKGRLCLLIDPETVQQQNMDTEVRVIESLKKWVPMCTEEYHSFLSLHHHFYLLHDPGDLLLFQLLDEGFQIKVKHQGSSMPRTVMPLLEVFVNQRTKQ